MRNRKASYMRFCGWNSEQFHHKIEQAVSYSITHTNSSKYDFSLLLRPANKIMCEHNFACRAFVAKKEPAPFIMCRLFKSTFVFLLSLKSNQKCLFSQK